MANEITVTLLEAQRIAYAALEAIATQSGWGHIKDLVGRELDLTDEVLDKAVNALNAVDKTDVKAVVIKEDLSLRGKGWVNTIYPIVKGLLMELPDEFGISDKEIIEIANDICQAIDKKFQQNTRGIT